MRKNQVLPTPEFRARLQTALREVARTSNIRQMAAAAEVDHSNLTKALAVDPESGRWDSVLLQAGDRLLGLGIEHCVRIIRIGKKNL